MKKKILVISILAVFTLIAISFATAINTTTPVKKKETPLYRIRLTQAIREKGREILSKFIGERIFFVPAWLFQFMKFPKVILFTGEGHQSCRWTKCYLCTDYWEDCTEMEQCTLKCEGWFETEEFCETAYCE